jgi:hypothetical protein
LSPLAAVHESLPGPTDAEARATMRTNPCFYGDDVAGKPQSLRRLSTSFIAQLQRMNRIN